MHCVTVIDMFSFCRIYMDGNYGDGLEIPNVMITLHDRIQDTAPIINSSPRDKMAALLAVSSKVSAAHILSIETSYVGYCYI